MRNLKERDLTKNSPIYNANYWNPNETYRYFAPAFFAKNYEIIATGGNTFFETQPDTTYSYQEVNLPALAATNYRSQKVADK